MTPSLANSAGGGLLGLTKTGAGTWVLAGASSYTGPTLVSVGTLTLNSGESLASLNDTVSSGAVFNVSGTLSSSVNLTDNGTINENGTSQTIASLNGSGALNLHGTVLTISNGGSFSGVIADTSSGAKLTLTGGVLALSNVNTYGGGTNINGGTLNFAALGNLGTGAINFGGGTLQYATGNMADISVRTVTFNSGGGTIDTNGNSPVTFANPIGNSGVGGLTKAGGGTLVLNGASYTGSTSVTGGTLELASGSVASTSFIAGVGTILTVDSGVTLSLSSNLTDNGTVNLNNASQTVASLNGAGLLNLNSPTALTVTNGGAFSGVIAGPGSSVTLTGGTLALSGTTASTFSGGLNINGGTLNFARLINLGSGGINFGGGTLQHASGNMADISMQTVTINAGGGTIDTNGNSPVVFASSIGNSGVGGLTKVGAGTLVLNGASYMGSTTVTGGTLELASGSLASTAVTVGSGAVLMVDSAATLSASTALSDAGTTNLNNASQTIATLNGAGLLNLNGTALNITNGGAFSGVIADPAASVTVSGGAMLLSGANTYVGDTDVTDGSLEIAAPGSLASANVNVSAMASLTVDSGATISSSTALGNGGVVNFNNASPAIATLNGGGTVNLVSTPLTISGGGAFSGVIADGGGGAGLIVSGGTMLLSGNNTFVGNTHVTGGILTLASTGALASPAITIDAGAVANINGILNASPAITANGSANFGVADVNNDPMSGILARSVSSLTIGSTGNVTVAPATSSTTRTALVVTSALSNSGTLDLANNDMIVKGGNVTAITQQVVSGAITSSTAATHPFGNTTLAVVLNSGGVFSTFDNQSVSSSDVLVKYTFYGDADLSGGVDASDYILIDSGFNSQGTANPLGGWYNGDFNYDGTINGDDYTLIDNAFNTQGSVSYAGVSVGPTEMIAGATEQIAAVPEPGSIGLLGLATVLLPRRRRR